MKRRSERTPRGYNGTKLTTRNIEDLLPKFMNKVGAAYSARPDLLIAAWPSIIGPKLAPMTRALSFIDGVMTIQVTNSTLYSLLNQHEKPRLLRELKKRFPNIGLKNLRFRIG